MTRSHILRGKPDSFDGLSKATLTELPERRHEEGDRGEIGGKKQLCDNRANMSRSTKISSCKMRFHIPSSSVNPLSRHHRWRQRCSIAVWLLREFGVKTEGNPYNS